MPPSYSSKHSHVMLFNSETQLLLVGATSACLVLGFAILILHRSANRKAICQKKKERLAKQSFQIRKSDLLFVSGRHRRNSNKNKPWRSTSKRVIGESYESTTWLNRIGEYFLPRDRFASQHDPPGNTKETYDVGHALENDFDALEIKLSWFLYFVVVLVSIFVFLIFFPQSSI